MAPPWITSSLQATLIGVLSNLSAQVIDAYRKSIPFHFALPDFARFVFYTALTAPPNFFWQVWLERVLPARTFAARGYENVPQEDDGYELVERMKEEQVGRDSGLEAEVLGSAGSIAAAPTVGKARAISWKNTFAKWFIDCITLGAILNTVAFFFIIGALKGQNVSQILETTRTDTIPLIIAGYKIWPFASVINFTLIPVEKRIVFLSAVGYVWDVYLSLIAASK